MIRYVPLILACACGSSDVPAWALQHAVVTISPDGDTIEGYQTWEFYNQDWEDGRKQEDHLCARVQSLVGAAEGTLPDGCPGCIASYEISVEELETDCTTDVADDPSYAGVTRYAIGAVDNSVESLDPYPSQSLGWYVAWSTDEVEPLGFAWNEALDQGEEPEASGWVEGLGYTLWPAFVWDLAAR